MTKEERIKRLEKEHNELTERMSRLDNFMRQSPAVGERQRELIGDQFMAMAMYQTILAERIDDLKGDNDD